MPRLLSRASAGLLPRVALAATAAATMTAADIHVVTEIMSDGGVTGQITYRLVAQLDSSMSSLYAIYGDSDHHMLFPGGYQTAAPFGTNVGGTNPAFWAYQADAQYDSWLTVGVDDGSAKSALTSIGIDWDSWTADDGLDIDDGAIFWMDRECSRRANPTA